MCRTMRAFPIGGTDMHIIDSSQTRRMLEHSKELLTLYKTLQDERMNRILNILTLVTSAFLPAQFLSGLYGMNFSNMPELDWEYSYYVWWVVVIAGCGGVIFLFHRHRLI